MRFFKFDIENNLIIFPNNTTFYMAGVLRTF